MNQREQHRPGRREALSRFAAFGAVAATTPFMLSCDAQRPDVKPFIPKERSSLPQEGDIVFYNNDYFLLRNGKRYPIQKEALETYKRLTKFDKFKRRLIVGSFENVQRLPLGIVPDKPAIIDPFTGDIKVNKSQGGEMNIFFSGYTDATIAQYDGFIHVDRTFSELRGKDGLEKGKWKDVDSLYFTYGVRNKKYEVKDTIQDPREVIKQVDAFMKEMKEQFPLVQFNLIGHSLGGLYAIEAAKRHADAINTVVVVSAPVRGLEPTIDKKFVKVPAVRTLLQTALGVEERVIDYLFSLWEDKKYQHELDIFSQAFVASGKILISAASKDDQIVPAESSELLGAKKLEEKMGTANIVVIGDVFGIAAHLAPAKNEKVIATVAENLGENLWAAAA